MTESVNDDEHHGDDKGRRTSRKRQVLVACQADQPCGSADEQLSTWRMRHRRKGVGRAPWQETMDISHEIGPTHN